MPVVLRYKGYALYFYSSEGVPREPMHIHVRGHGGEAKSDLFVDSWRDYFDE